MSDPDVLLAGGADRAYTLVETIDALWLYRHAVDG